MSMLNSKYARVKRFRPILNSVHQDVSDHSNADTILEGITEQEVDDIRYYTRYNELANL